MQFTTYIDLVIFPWGYQTENVKESQCGVMERKKVKELIAVLSSKAATGCMKLGT